MKKSKIIVAVVVLAALLVVINSNNNVFGYSWSGENSSSGGGGGGGAGGCKSPRDYYTPTIACGVSWIYYKYSGTPYAQSNSNDPGPMFKFQPHRNNSNFTIPSACSVTGGFWHLGSTIKFNSDRWGTTNSLTPEKSESNLWEYENNKYGHADTWTWKVSTWSDYNLDSGSEWTDNLLGHKVKVPGLSGSFNAAYFGTTSSVLKSYKEYISSSANGIPTDVYAFCAGDPKKPDMNKVDTTSRMRVTGGGLDTGWNESGKDSVTKNSSVVRTVHGANATIETRHKGFRSAETSSDNINFSVSVGKTMKQGADLNTTVTKKGDGSNFSNSWSFAKDSSEKEWAATNKWSLPFSPDSSAWACEGIVHKAKVNSKGETSGDNEKSGYCELIRRPPAYFEGSISIEANGINAKDQSMGAKKETIVFNGSTNTSAVYNLTEIVLPADSGKYSVKFNHNIKRVDTKNDTAGDKVSTLYKSYTRKTDYFKKKSSYYAQDGNSSSYSTTAELYDGANSTASPSSQNVLNQAYTHSSAGDGELLYGEVRKFCTTLTLFTKQGRNQVEKSKTACVTIRRERKGCAINTAKKFGVNGGENLGRITAKNITTGSSQSQADSGSPLVAVYAKPGDSILFTREMCAGAFYATEVNGLKGKPEYNTRYGTSGKITKSDYNYTGNNTDGYLFRETAAVVKGNYRNPAQYEAINGKWWRWSNGVNGGVYVKDLAGDKSSGGFMSSLLKAEDTVLSPSSSATGYNCPNGGQNGVYQVSGKDSGCHTNMFDANSDKNGVDKFDVGGEIEQTLSWNNMSISITNSVDRTVTVSNPNNEKTAIVSVKVPYNYRLKPYVTNMNSGNSDQKVIYLGEKYEMQPGVVTAGRKNNLVTRKVNESYATITKETSVRVSTVLKRSGNTIQSNYGQGGGNYEKHGLRFNRDGNLNYASDTTNKVSFTVADSDGGSWEAPRVGDEICTTIEVWPADSHDDYNTEFVDSSKGGANNSRGNNGIALKETSDDENNKRSTTSCSRIAKRPTISIEGANAYSKSGYTMSRYTKTIDGGSYNFSSWSEYGVFGKINKRDSHLISGAAVAYSRQSGYGPGQDMNRERSNNGLTSLAISKDDYGSKCIFETQTLVNSSDCSTTTFKSNADIGGQSVKDYVQKIKSRYGDTKEASAAVSYSGKWGEYNILNIEQNQADLEKYTKTSSNAVILKLNNNTYIGEKGVPGILPESFKHTNEDGTEDEIDYNRTLVYDAGDNGTIVLDNDIILNDNNASLDSLDDIAGGVIIANKVYITDKVKRIDAIIIANEVNTCAYANGAKIEGINNLHAGICNNSLIFNAPVIVSDGIILNRTAGADNGTASIKRAEIFNLSMANYLWSYNQMSRYSQAITTYSRELPSRY